MEQSWAMGKVNCYRGELVVLYLYKKLQAIDQSVRVGTFLSMEKEYVQVAVACTQKQFRH
jgi:hypothetical protein